MTKRLLTLAMVAAFATAAFAQPQTAKPQTAKPKPLAIVQGSWLFTSVNGQDSTGGPEIVVTITDDKYTQVTNGEVVERGSFKLDETKKPMLLDLVITEGQQAGMTQVGLVEVTGTTMRGKLSEPGGTERPTDLTPSDGFFAFTAIKKQ